ncbi:MAG TPA: type II toxin-antitoxin system VapC family toxin [Candidatus Acidoferrum sp.]|nr:type II toxin-antitoxin system VapC family toxin [Candidatus Acidoferrum sp.]
MTTSLDTNILVALWNPDEAQNLAVKKALVESQAAGKLLICGPVYAELLVSPARNEEFLDNFCAQAFISVEWELSEQVWREAGIAYQKYGERRRKQGTNGPRRILADFLIGAHAMVGGYRLLTLDGRLYRAAFPKLRVATV